MSIIAANNGETDKRGKVEVVAGFEKQEIQS